MGKMERHSRGKDVCLPRFKFEQRGRGWYTSEPGLAEEEHVWR